MTGEDSIHARGVGDVGKQRLDLHVEGYGAQLPIDVEERVLVVVDKQQRMGHEPHELPAELAADATASAGDQHYSAAHQVIDLRDVKLHRIAPQQVIDVDLADAAPRDAGANHIRQRWDRFDLHAERAASAQYLTHAPARRGRHGQHNQLDLLLPHIPLDGGIRGIT